MSSHSQTQPSQESLWIQVGIVFTLLSVPALLPQFFTWDFRAEFFGFFAAAGCMVTGLVWLAIGLGYKRRRFLVIALLMCAASVFVLGGALEWTKARVTLYLRKDDYQKQVDRILNSQESPDLKGVTVDRTGGGVRVAFDLGAAFLDNAKSIVYDPSGEVAKPRKTELDDCAPFGGNFNRVQHLSGDWYFLYLFPGTLQ